MLKLYKQHEKTTERWSEIKKHAKAMGLQRQLARQLRALHRMSFGGVCLLGYDFAPLSMGFSVQRNGRTVINGGLIYQGPGSPADGSAPSFTVSLATGTGWFLHT